jgi:hypothetical protein
MTHTHTQPHPQPHPHPPTHTHRLRCVKEGGGVHSLEREGGRERELERERERAGPDGPQPTCRRTPCPCCVRPPMYVSMSVTLRQCMYVGESGVCVRVRVRPYPHCVFVCVCVCVCGWGVHIMYTCTIFLCRAYLVEHICVCLF